MKLHQAVHTNHKCLHCLELTAESRGDEDKEVKKNPLLGLRMPSHYYHVSGPIIAGQPVLPCTEQTVGG